MKTRTSIMISFCLLFFSAGFNLLHAALTVDVQGGELFVETDQNGVGGLQGCKEEKLREVPAFIFNLYRLDDNVSDRRSRDGTHCEPTSRDWRIFSQKSGSNSGRMGFSNLPSGDYKVIVYYGEAEGCDLSSIEGQSADHPSQAIIYNKEIPAEFSIDGSSESLALQNSKLQNLQFEIYPNPAKDQVSIELTEGVLTSNIKITVFDLLGRSIIDSNSQAALANCDYQCQINVDDLPSGAYLIRIQDDEGQLLHQEKMMVIKE